VAAASFLDPMLRSPSEAWVLRNARNRRVLASRIEPAFDSSSRRRGLLGRSELPDGTAMVLAPCNSIHMFFMRFAIDVVFVNRTGEVVKTYPLVRPWRIRLAARGFAAVELPEGTIDRTDTRTADRLELTRE
jgi:uncharacterized membrane protein (UPF0127 family)